MGFNSAFKGLTHEVHPAFHSFVSGVAVSIHCSLFKRSRLPILGRSTSRQMSPTLGTYTLLHLLPVFECSQNTKHKHSNCVDHVQSTADRTGQ